jgi:F-type H+-transporting ATPase subunit delta
MKFSLQQYAQALYESFQDVTPRDHDKIITNFINILKDNGDLEHYEAIVSEYERVDREERGIKQVEVTVARDMEINSSLIKQLNQLVGKDIELRKKVDASLIGGIVIKVEDNLLDASVKGQLNKLKDNLI